MKKVLSVVIASSLVITLGIGASFADSHQQSALKVLKDKGVVEGFADGKLHEGELLTRAQFAQILCNAFETADWDEGMEFKDLSKKHWAYDSIQRAVNSGWLSGYSDQKFGADDYITYEQAVTVMCRVANLYGFGAYPACYLSAAIDAGITDNVDAMIGDKISREQAARLIVNVQDYMKENDIQPCFSGRNVFAEEEMSVKASSSSGGSGGGGSGALRDKAYDVTSFAPYNRIYAEPIHPEYGDFNTEEYTANEENVFKDTYTSPLSTFSIDTDTASYSNLRRFILNGQNVATGSIRSEELINYFDYEGKEVKKGEVFGVDYELAKCPWNEKNKLAMISVNGEQMSEYRPSNLVFLIDTSGSMYDSNKLPLVKRALEMLLKNLDEGDKISVVTYASGTRVALEPTPATEKEKIISVIDSLRAGGSTAGESGINLAYEMAERAFIDGNNRIILCTDGDFNVGIRSEGDLEKLIEEKRKSGIYLSVLGFGMGNYKDNKMETLADKGNGNYAYIDNIREAKKVLVDEMSKTIYTIAKDVKIQVEFNPSKVKSYRLVGYENRVLNNEDFENDMKDAGELGAGSDVTVFYEIIPADGTEKNELKYQDVTPKESLELMTVKIRYKLPEGNESILREYPVADEITENTSDDFKFAASVAELGMILNESEYKGTSTFDSVMELARSGRGEDIFGLRSEFVQLVDLLRYNRRQ